MKDIRYPSVAQLFEDLSKGLDCIVADLDNLKDYSRFHKDKKERIGISSSVLKKFSTENFRKIKFLSKDQILSLCEKLLKMKCIGSRSLAFDWSFRVKKNYEKKDFKVFESWLKKYVDSWGSCDDLCTHSLGYFLYKFPEFTKEVKVWIKSKNRWLRRASAVSLIFSIRKEQGLKNVLNTADTLLLDKDDLVQKGYGWMLKEASNKYQKEIFEFVMKRKNKMPRTALRYAIEKMPAYMKKRAML
ncbi:MAG: DNA alkylation repair protein [Patescibacteria group bacterium]